MTRAAIATLILVLGAASSAWGYRVLEQVEDNYELMLGEVSLPRNSGGSVIFKPCAECLTTSLRVTASTIYLVNGSAVVLEDFLRAAEGFRDTDGGNRMTAVYVFYDIESKRVNRLAMDYFGG